MQEVCHPGPVGKFFRGYPRICADPLKYLGKKCQVTPPRRKILGKTRKSERFSQKVKEKARNVDKVKKYVEYTTYEDLPIQAEIVSALQATQNGTRATIHDPRTRVQKKHGKRYFRCAFSENAEKKGVE